MYLYICTVAMYFFGPDFMSLFGNIFQYLSICFSRLMSTAMLVDDASGISVMQNFYKFDTFSTSKCSI